MHRQLLLAVEPDVILMDEPASALDLIATTRIEDLMHELKREYTIVIVTHNMQQAARVADMTAFFSVEVAEGGDRTGSLSSTTDSKIFTNPADKRHGGLRHRTNRLGWGRSLFRKKLDQPGACRRRWSRPRALRGASMLARRDVKLADEVIAFDDEVDASLLDLEQGIESLLAAGTNRRPPPGAGGATRHPAPERMADYSVTIAKLTKLVHSLPSHPPVTEAFQEMGERAEQMIRTGLDCLANRDLETAE